MGKLLLPALTLSLLLGSGCQGDGSSAPASAPAPAAHPHGPIPSLLTIGPVKDAGIRAEATARATTILARQGFGTLRLARIHCADRRPNAIILPYRVRCIAAPAGGRAAEYVVFFYKNGTYGVVSGGPSGSFATLVSAN